MLMKYGSAVCPFPVYPERTEPAPLWTPNAFCFGELNGAYTVGGHLHQQFLMSEAYNARQDKVYASPKEVHVFDETVRSKTWEKAANRFQNKCKKKLEAKRKIPEDLLNETNYTLRNNVYKTLPGYMNASSHGTPDSDVQTVHIEENVNAEPTAYVDSVDRLDRVDRNISSQVVRVVDSVVVGEMVA